MAYVITAAKILETAQTAEITYQGKHRKWVVYKDRDGSGYGLSALPRTTAPDNYETYSIIGTWHPDLFTALDHMAWGETRDIG